MFNAVKNLPKRIWIHDEEEPEKKKEEPISSPIINGKKFIGSGEDANYPEYHSTTTI